MRKQIRIFLRNPESQSGCLLICSNEQPYATSYSFKKNLFFFSELFSPPKKKGALHFVAVSTPPKKNARERSSNTNDHTKDRDVLLAKGTDLQDIFDPVCDDDDGGDDENSIQGLRRLDHHIPDAPPKKARIALSMAPPPQAVLGAGVMGRMVVRPQKYSFLNFDSRREFFQTKTYQRKPEDVLQTKLNFRRPHELPSGTVGLRNLGNTCYMNSSLQAILVFEKLMNEICDEGRVKLAEAATSPGKTSLLSAFRRFWLDARSGGMVLSPSKIKELISIGSSARFGGNQQEDAHEFFSAMLNALEEAYEEATKKTEGPV